MNPGYLYVAATVLLTCFGQLAIKWQVQRLVARGPAGTLAFYTTLLRDPWVLAGLASAFGASLFWMAALSRLPISRAYPLTAASFAIVVALGAWLFDEKINPTQWLGVLAIMAGVALVART